MKSTQRRSPRKKTVGLPSPVERFVLYNISWPTYESLVVDQDRLRVFLTYDDGTLELMVGASRRCSHLLARIVEQYTLERNIAMLSFGRTTWRNPVVAKGLEAHDSYYIRNWNQIDIRNDITLPRDPPPDLAIDTDLSECRLDKKSVYAALGIGELWNWENDCLTVFELQPNGSYRKVKFSPTLPDLPLPEIERCMSMRRESSDTELIHSLSQWVRDRFDSEE